MGSDWPDGSGVIGTIHIPPARNGCLPEAVHQEGQDVRDLLRGEFLKEFD